MNFNINIEYVNKYKLIFLILFSQIIVYFIEILFMIRLEVVYVISVK